MLRGEKKDKRQKLLPNWRSKRRIQASKRSLLLKKILLQRQKVRSNQRNLERSVSKMMLTQLNLKWSIK